MHVASSISLHRINRLVNLKNQLQEIYLNQIIQSFALSLIGIFIPIYLFSIGFDLYMIFNYYIIFFTTKIFYSAFLSSFYTKIGLKHSISVSTIPLITQYILLQILGHVKNYSLFYIIPIIGGLWSSIYWISLNSEFVKNSHKSHEGSEISNLMAFPKLAAAFAPFFGALILNSLGFDFLFIIVIAMIMLSVAPLFVTSDSKKKFHYKVSDFILFFRNKSHIYLFADGVMFSMELIAWPLFVYILFDDLMSIGLLATISSIGILIFTFVMGRLANRGVNKRKMMKIGAILYGLVLASRAFVTNLGEVYILSFLGGLFSTMVAISVYARFVDEARSRNIVASNVARHIWTSFGFIFPILVILYFFGFEIGLIASAFVIIVSLLI